VVGPKLGLIEGFEPINLLVDGFRNLDRSPSHRFDIAGEQPQHTLLPKAMVRLAHRVRMRVHFLGSLCDRAIGEQHQQAD
jgi:hypothetical protein